MASRVSLILLFLVGACSSAGSSAGSSDGSSAGSSDGSASALTAAHATAMRDSVQLFLQAYAADLSAPPVGKKAREAVSSFYAQEIVVSTDLAPDEPVLIQTLDSLVPPDEVVSVPAWIRSTRFEWGTMVIAPLAPGVASYTAKYSEHVTDTSGTVTDLPGVQHGVVRNGASGWRIVSLQSSHPMAMHQRQAALVAKVTGAK